MLRLSTARQILVAHRPERPGALLQYQPGHHCTDDEDKVRPTGTPWCSRAVTEALVLAASLPCPRNRRQLRWRPGVFNQGRADRSTDLLAGVDGGRAHPGVLWGSPRSGAERRPG